MCYYPFTRYNHCLNHLNIDCFPVNGDGHINIDCLPVNGDGLNVDLRNFSIRIAL